MSDLTNIQQNKLERDRLLALRQAKSARFMRDMINDHTLAMDPPSSDDEDDPLPVKKKTSKKTATQPEPGRMEFKHGNIMHYINGKKTTTESAYNTYNFAAYIAGAITMYHTAIGDTTNINVEVFSAILTNAFMVYGPKQQLELSAVAACLEHINDHDINPWDAMSTASRAIRSNGPARVYADAVIVGKTGMIADLSTGVVVVPQESGLSIRATQSLAPLLMATIAKPAQAMEEIIADLGHFDKNLAPVLDYLENAVATATCPQITENNSFRRLSKVPGTMSNDSLVRSKHGVYQAALKCLESYHEDTIDLLVVPGYTTGMSGSYDSMGSVSRVIPLPDSPEHYSLTLLSVVEPYEDGLRSLLKLEADRKADPEVRKIAGSARSALHAPYAAHYTALRTEPQGRTLRDLRYVRLASQEFVGTSDLIDGVGKGKYDHSPALVRVSDFFHAQVKSLKGFCIITDLPMMVGLYVSPIYVQNYFKDSLRDRRGRPVSVDGFYVLNPGPKGSETHYSAWIEKYMFAHITGTLLGPEAKEVVLTQYLSGYKEQRRENDVIRMIIRDLRVAYDKQVPSLSKVVILTPGYSAHKAFKYGTMMPDYGTLEDSEFQDAVHVIGKEIPVPANDDVPTPPSDTGGGLSPTSSDHMFSDWSFGDDDMFGDDDEAID